MVGHAEFNTTLSSNVRTWKRVAQQQAIGVTDLQALLPNLIIAMKDI
jgi:hypothetical protein